MTVQSVLTRFAALAELTPEEATEWSSLAQNACAQIKARTQGVEETQQNNELLETAAAALTFYEYKTVEASRRGVTSFKAGDVSFDLGGGGAADAYKMYQSALEACSKLPQGGDFVFGRMEQLCTEN